MSVAGERMIIWLVLGALSFTCIVTPAAPGSFSTADPRPPTPDPGQAPSDPPADLIETPDGVELDGEEIEPAGTTTVVRAEPIFDMDGTWDYRMPRSDPGSGWAAAATRRRRADGWSEGRAPFVGRAQTPEERRERPQARDVEVEALPDGTRFVYIPERFPAADALGPTERGPVVWQFARTFDVEDPASVVAAVVEARFSAGIVAYLNGREWFRGNVDPGRGGFLQPADVAETPRWIRQTRAGAWQRAFTGLDPSALRATGNVLAVQVHRRREGGDTAMQFDLRLGVHRRQGFAKRPYLQNLRADGVTVLWETAAPTTGAVRFGAGARLDRSAASDACSTFHEVPLAGLDGDAEHSYRVEWSDCGGAEASSAPPRRGAGVPERFRTMPAPGTPFAFVAYGDSRGNPRRHARVATGMIEAADSAGARFALHTGDITDHGDDYADWQDQFFDPAAPMLATLPLFPTLGNHEYLNAQYYGWFSLPGNESWYSFTAGDAEFFVLNAYTGFSAGSEQMRWLEGALAAGRATWKIVALHQPLHTCRDRSDRRRTARRTRDLLAPILSAGGVRLVFSGHDHLYGRSKPVDGIVNVVTGGGGAGLYPASGGADMEVCRSEHHFVLVRVSPAAIEVTAIGDGGAEIDRFEMRAGGGG